MELTKIYDHLERIFDRYSEDNGYSAYYRIDPIASYARSLQDSLESLERRSLSSNTDAIQYKQEVGLRAAVDAKMLREKIANTLEEMRSDPEVKKYVKKYSKLLDEIDSKKDSLYEECVKRNNITKNLEVECAERMIEELKQIYDKTLPGTVKGLEDIIKKDINTFVNYRIDGYNRDVLACLSDAYDKYKFISDLPKNKENEKELPALKKQVKEIYELIRLQAIIENDRLIKLDSELNSQKSSGTFFTKADVKYVDDLKQKYLPETHENVKGQETKSVDQEIDPEKIDRDNEGEMNLA